jgi:hypothetical protein
MAGSQALRFAMPCDAFADKEEDSQSLVRMSRVGTHFVKIPQCLLHPAIPNPHSLPD